MPGHAKQTERVSRGVAVLAFTTRGDSPARGGASLLFLPAITAITRLAMAQAKPP